MTNSNGNEPLPFPELWERFLAWRIAVLEWRLSPKQVFQELEPMEELEVGQFLTDERHRAIERLLLNPDSDLRQAFTEPYRDFINFLHEGNTDPEWWQGQIRPWLETFLSYAVATVPPNYRRNQLLLIPYEGLEPLKGCSPPENQLIH